MTSAILGHLQVSTQSFDHMDTDAAVVPFDVQATCVRKLTLGWALPLAYDGSA